MQKSSWDARQASCSHGCHAEISLTNHISLPAVPKGTGSEPSWRDVLLTKGPEGWAKEIRAHSGLLLTDTTWYTALSVCMLLLPVFLCYCQYAQILSAEGQYTC